MEKIRVILADDKVLFIESMKIVIETLSNGDIEVIGTANNGKEAIELVEKTPPDVILMDVRMPLMDGVKATRQILRFFPYVRVIMLTTFSDDEDVREALRFGAAGYLLKDIAPEELVSFIRTVNKGSVLLAPDVAKQLFQKQMHETAAHISQHKKQKERQLEFLEELTPREMEIYKLLTRGMNNREIADHLFIAEQTAKNHITKVYSKLGIHNRFDLFKENE